MLRVMVHGKNRTFNYFSVRSIHTFRSALHETGQGPPFCLVQIQWEVGNTFCWAELFKGRIRDDNFLTSSASRDQFGAFWTRPLLKWAQCKKRTGSQLEFCQCQVWPQEYKEKENRVLKEGHVSPAFLPSPVKAICMSLQVNPQTANLLTAVHRALVHMVFDSCTQMNLSLCTRCL